MLHGLLSTIRLLAVADRVQAVQLKQHMTLVLPEVSDREFRENLVVSKGKQIFSADF